MIGPSFPGEATALRLAERRTHLNISEWFGPTIQGEGPNAGRLSSFLRLAGCNLSCSWCDSAYTWDWTRFPHREETHPMTVAEVVDIVDGLPGRIIVTGGEPLLQAPALGAMLSQLPHTPAFDVETNGTRPLGETAPYWDTIICSPKVIPSADQGPLAHRLAEDVMEDRRTHLKLVIRDDADLDAAVALVQARSFDAERVWLMPEGTTTETLTERTPWLMDVCAMLGFNFTTRLHVYGWHDVRGH